MDIKRMQGVVRQMMEIHKEDFTTEELYVLRACFEALEIMDRLAPTLEKITEGMKNK